MTAIIKQIRLFQNRQQQEISVGFLASMFGCWHSRLSRPFTSVNESYRTCLDCGARKHFDPQTLKTYGKFYFTSAATLNRRQDA